MRRFLHTASLLVAFSVGLSGSMATHAADDISSFGQNFGSAPARLSPLFRGQSPPSIASIKAHLDAHDTTSALYEAQRFTNRNKWGRDRDAAWMVQGMLHRSNNHHNLASAAFTKVRGGGGPLAPWGAYYEAEQDLARGKYWVAAKECANYQKKWPEGRHTDACLRIMAVSYARAGAWKKARKAATEYDSDHSNAPITEQIELTLTLRALHTDPKAMIPRLQVHATEFHAPLTGRVAVEKLNELAEQGFKEAIIPQDTRSRKARAYSLRQTKQTELAWEAFSSIVMDTTPDDTDLWRWIQREADTFGWRTRNWDFLAKYYANRYAQDGDAKDAWRHFRVLSRGGRYKEAVVVGEAALKAHPKSRSFRRQHEAFGKTHLLAGSYPGARRHFDALAKRGGWTGLRGKYYAAFSGFMAADNDVDTLRRLSALVATNGTYSHEARYWRAQLFDRMERPEDATADRKALLAQDPDSWYSALTRARQTAGDKNLDRRDGQWAGDPWQEPPTVEGTPPAIHSAAIPIAAPTPIAHRARASGFANLLWGASSSADITFDPPTQLLSVDPNLPPVHSIPNLLFDAPKISEEVRKYTERYARAWPELRASRDLARVGLTSLSGPLFSAVYEEWRRAYRLSRHKKHSSARAMKQKSDEWRALFNFMGDSHHAARFNHSWWRSVDDPDLAKEARKIGYPLAHARYVWSHSREHNVDPYLVLGLMRQESTYNSMARSPVGARGAMQIMPRTGHLLANLRHDVAFNAGDLEDPVLSVGYGITYIGLLLERFDGAYPLAIAAYNGGPFNVSSWLRGTTNKMPMDAFVEHIPFRETRNYVKKVSAGYSTYLTLYAPDGTLLAPPTTPRGDHPEIVDF